ncbi:MAG: ion transporter [Marinilabiliales bacterium]|nr:MAG: ion transporter [Marinilabiliales bacterium]
MTKKTLKQNIYEIIFEADTPVGKVFDITLLIAIILSVIIVMLDSVHDLAAKYGGVFSIIEWVLTILFTIEYILRIYSVKKSSKYIFSFYGIIDLLSILPTYIGLFLVGGHYLMIIRILRLLRVFRVLKLARYVTAARSLGSALNNSRAKIIVFLEVVISVVIIIGSIMYLIEGPENGFTSIPVAIYWSIVTITTVGYGDIAPQTVLGQSLASVLMIIGYAIIAVPTGIISSEMIMGSQKKGKTAQVCQNCMFEDHDEDAKYCKKCGEKLS